VLEGLNLSVNLLAERMLAGYQSHPRNWPLTFESSASRAIRGAKTIVLGQTAAGLDAICLTFV
jgi:hypothetical protein